MPMNKLYSPVHYSSSRTYSPFLTKFKVVLLLFLTWFGMNKEEAASFKKLYIRNLSYEL